MEADLRKALKALGIENIDEIIKFLKREGLLDDAWLSRNNLKKFLEGYGSFKSIFKPSPLGNKTVIKFVFHE